MQYRLMDTKIQKIEFLNNLTVQGQVDLTANYHTTVAVDADNSKIVIANAQFDMNGSQQDDGDSYLKVELHVVGIFEAQEETNAESIDNNELHTAMFPYVRAYISALTALSGMSAITLPDMTVVKKK